MEEQVEEVEEPPPKQLESMVLAVAHHWSRRETKDRQVELIERHFRKDEMFNALLALNKLVGRKGPQNRQATSARTAAKAQAEDVVNAIVELGDQAKLPRFLVQSEDLHRVLPLLGALAVSDERTVAVRLEALEAAQRNNMVEMRRLVASTMAGVPTAHQWSAQAAHLISAPGAPERSAPGAPERSALGAPLPVPSLVVTKPDYATAAGAGGRERARALRRDPDGARAQAGARLGTDGTGAQGGAFSAPFLPSHRIASQPLLSGVNIEKR